MVSARNILMGWVKVSVTGMKRMIAGITRVISQKIFFLVSSLGGIRAADIENASDRMK